MDAMVVTVDQFLKSAGSEGILSALSDILGLLVRLLHLHRITVDD